METREKESPRKPTKLVVSVVQVVGASKIVEEVIKDLADKCIASFLDGPNLFVSPKCHLSLTFWLSLVMTLIKSPVSMTLTERELKSLVDMFCKEWRGPNTIPRP